MWGAGSELTVGFTYSNVLLIGAIGAVAFVFEVCAGSCAMGLVAPIALYLLHGVLPDPWDFLVYFVLIGGSFTGQTYWRAIVLCWTL